MFMKNNKNAPTQQVRVMMYVSKKHLAGKNPQVTAVIVSGIMFLIMFTRIVQFVHSSNLTKDYYCFQTTIHLHDTNALIRLIRRW